MSDGPADRAERTDRTDRGGDDAGSDEEGERPAGADGGDGGPDGDRDAPLGELAERVRRSRARSETDGDDGGTDADPFAALERAVEGEGEGDVTGTGTEPGTAAAGSGPPADDDPFERVEVDEVDEEEVWESLAADEGTAAERASIGAGADAERVERDDPGAERPDHVVEKAAYCQRCRFFSSPPEVRCTHDGTDIVEVVDVDRFRVRGCPMVAQRGAIDREPDRNHGDRERDPGRDDGPD